MQWWSHGIRHRDDGPAVVEEHEMKQWWANGKLHREDGPAIEYEDGTQEWFLLNMPATEDVVMDADKRAEFMKKQIDPV